MTEAKLKYLEFLQACIARMASNSFLIKGWSVTLGTAVVSFSIKDHVFALALVAVLPALAFWMLDAYYLALERLYCGLWSAAIKEETPTFSMHPGNVTKQLWKEAAERPAVLLVHGPVIAGALLTAGVLYPWCH